MTLIVRNSDSCNSSKEERIFFNQLRVTVIHHFKQHVEHLSCQVLVAIKDGRNKVFIFTNIHTL